MQDTTEFVGGSPDPVAPPGGWPARWRGHWIGPSAPAPPSLAVSLGASTSARRFGRHLFATTVAVPEVPGRVPCRVTADSRYVLLVNGVEVGRGPVRSQPRRLRYDSHDLAGHLRAGSNTVVLLVTYYGEANSFWAPAAPNATLGADAVAVFEGRPR